VGRELGRLGRKQTNGTAEPRRSDFGASSNESVFWRADAADGGTGHAHRQTFSSGTSFWWTAGNLAKHHSCSPLL